ncbi:MAG: hypothetical protein JSS91_11385 [Bacteroidetes bacterium]|nr:hypothetical protein [Bacteroidota bacterium]
MISVFYTGFNLSDFSIKMNVQSEIEFHTRSMKLDGEKIPVPASRNDFAEVAA